jgi:membrane protein required for colicin V production
MNGADHLFAIIMLVSGALGFFRGFIREAISLASWLIGLWLAWHFAYVVYPWLGGALADPGVREWTGRAIVLFAVLLVGAGVGAVVAFVVRRAAGLAILDRALGALFGLARGAIVIGLLVLAGRAVNLDLEPWWERTNSMAAAENVANWLERYARPAAVEALEKAKEKPGS